jgi:murein DD-endopeptidase MepM/ murein hydrolase activator NlpD
MRVQQIYRGTSDASAHIYGSSGRAPSTLAGIDFITARGNAPDLLAMADGIVEYAHVYNPKNKWDGVSWDSLGKFLVININFEGMTVWLRYAHAERIDVQAGQAVAKGQYIGVYGDTGYSFGAHAHIDTWVARGDLDKAKVAGLKRVPITLRVVPPWPGAPALYNVDPTTMFSAAGLDVVKTGGA